MKSVKKIKCPCCSNYTIDKYEEIIVEICPVCFWQYDWVAQNNPKVVIGPNNVSLEEAKINYQKYGVSEIIFKDEVRTPFIDELPQNNK